jgi:hypothetical protein
MALWQGVCRLHQADCYIVMVCVLPRTQCGNACLMSAVVLTGVRFSTHP